MGAIKLRCGMVVLAIALAIAACSPAPPTAQTATDGTFEVEVSVAAGTHHAADALGVVATLTYEGPQPSITVDADGTEGFVWFVFKQLDGSLEMGGGSRLICSPSSTMVRGSAATFHPAKSAA